MHYCTHLHCLVRPTTRSFGPPPSEIRLESGHHGVAALAAGLTSGSLDLGPGNVADVLQAASYLQVCAVRSLKLRACCDSCG